ncbi:MAG: putative Ig domain-containing protein [Acidobacteria bacterium]|nr:putative Ig domain-containing protein [Acidobacteriota bacterium]
MALHRVGSPARGALEGVFFSSTRVIRLVFLLLLALSASLSIPQAIAGDAIPKIAKFGRLNLSASLPSATVGLPYSGQIRVQGGTAPYKFSLVDGSAPAGLLLNSANGAVTGTPKAAGTTYFWVKASDAYGAAGKRRVHISVQTSSGPGSGPGVSLAISPTGASLTSGASQQFSATVQGTGNTAVSWSASAGNISSTGMFTAPVVSNNTNVSVTATSVADTTKNASASVTVTPAGAVSVSVSPASATLAAGGRQQFTATVQGTTNSAVSWSVSAGTITSVGLFTAPQVSSATTVSVVATSAADTTKQASASVAVSPASASGLAISTSSLPGMQAGVAYAYTLLASGGTTPYKWNMLSGSLPQGLTLNASGQLAGSSTQTGQYPFTVQVTDAANSTVSKALALSVLAPPPPPPPPSSSGGFDGPAELPRTSVQTAMANTPAPGSTVLVNSGGSLQNALNSANCGDTIELAAGASFTGPFTLPAKSCDDQHWIIVRTSAPDASLPPEGTRITPCYAGVASLPGRPAFHCPSNQNVLAQIIEPQSASGPILIASGANHYRLLGLEITRPVGTGIVYDMVSVPTGAADKIILDRVWLHGVASDETKNGFALSGLTNAALIDSYANDFHCTSIVGTCTDAQVIGGGNSTVPGGPYKISNNFLEASGEAILFGGGGGTTTPTDIEIRHNHFFKPLTWLSGQPGFVGGASGHPFMVKNALELKNAQRVLIEGNIFEYSWGGFSQVGFLILLTPKNQGGQCSVCQVTDVTIRYNTLSHSGTGISIADATSDSGASGTAGERYSIHDITIDDINMSLYNGGGAAFQVINAWPATPLNNVVINHVTAFPDPMSKIISLGNDSTNQTMYGFTFTNNMIGTARFPIWSSGGQLNCAISSVPLTALNACFPQGYTFSNNALIAVNGNYPPSTWPGNNLFPSSAGAVQFANFNNGIGGDYTLLSSSPYKNAGTDGKDLGADISAIQSAIAGVY